MSQSPPAEPLVEMHRTSKWFGSVQVLFEVDFDVHPGEVHVLAGENGAGKSTLIKILAGVYSDYTGTIRIGGRTVRPESPQAAAAMGVAVIYQELSLVPTMSVADNIFLGRAPARFGWVSRRRLLEQSRRVLEQLGLEIEVQRPVEEYPVGVQQQIEIAKALSHSARVLVMDEPTSALTAPEVEHLFRVIEDLRRRGCGIVYITHKMEEIERLAHRITVLRDGRRVGSAPAAELPVAELIKWMVGREVQQQFPPYRSHIGAERLRLENFTVLADGAGGRPAVDRVSLGVRAGEIVGIGGLQGSGASQLLHGLFDARRMRAAGQVLLDGQPFRLASPHHSIRQGLALLTNDRKATGLVLSMSVVANCTLANLRRLAPLGWRRPRRERQAAERLAQSLRLQAASLDMEVAALSGGNQQKVALAKWLQTNPRVLLLDEPTRGIDVGAKQEIYRLMQQWTSQGIAIILITSEMPELLAMSDRVVVMHRGRVTAELDRREATAERVLAAAMGRATSV